MKQAEQHLVGKSITVIYEIKDPTEWRKTNPLRYCHDGLEAYCVSVGNVCDRSDKLREALQEILHSRYDESQRIAMEALSADDAQ